MNRERKKKLLWRWSFLLVTLMFLSWLPYIVFGFAIGLVLYMSELKVLNGKEVVLKISHGQVVDWLLAK